MSGAPGKASFNKWGGLVGFGAGRKRLIIASLALLIFIVAFIVVINFTPDNKVNDHIK